MRHNQLTHIRSVIYGLEKNYAFRLDLYRKKEVVNLETGRKVTTRIKYKIKKAIFLPNQIYRDFNYGSLIKMGTPNFQLGGLLDLKQRIIIIDKRKLPRDFIIDINDYLVFNHDRYEIKDITEFELADFWRLTIRQVEGENPNEVHEQVLTDYFVVDEFLNNTPNVYFERIKDILFVRQRFQKFTIHSQRVDQTVKLVDGIGEIL